MELLVVCWLLARLNARRARTYTAAQLEAVKRESALREGGAPRVEAPARQYRWWRYEGLY